MPSPRLLVVEGNSPHTMAEHVAAGGVPASKGYSDLLRELLPGAIVDICYPGDPAACLPAGEALAGYDGIAITGSALHVYAGGPEVMRQVDLTRAALATGTPLFGSCWGLQLIAAAAGGSVRKNPKGREIGFARGIRLTEAGRKVLAAAGGQVDVLVAFGLVAEVALGDEDSHQGPDGGVAGRVGQRAVDLGDGSLRAGVDHVHDLAFAAAEVGFGLGRH